ncbi:hypothetical protein [Vreelandella populi]|uniref:Uncharacterized protein n=1 Tax=Vreelandella populi TaxID=2498858 RepID=A0A433LG37_9GAMM|nr:hypothetical protein [Halomonas populi]RUR48787.1 hypothetical protein ELY37_02755 [Halomonas populi]
MDYYPDGLPPPLLNIQIAHTDNVARTELGSGRQRKEIMMQNTPSVFNAEFLMNFAQTQVFEGFYWQTLKSGVLNFLMPMTTPLGKQYYQSNFKSLYRGPVRSGFFLWKITAEIEIAKRPIVSVEDMQYPEDILYSSIFDLTINRDWPKR